MEQVYMKSWLLKLTSLLCATLCFGNTADAGISNIPPPKPMHVSVKREQSKSSSKSPASSSSRQKSKSSAKISSRKRAKNAQIRIRSSKSSSTSIKPTQAPVAPVPVRTSLLIKKMHPTKKAKTKAKSKSKGKCKQQRGKRGRAGKDGKRGKKGKKGSKGAKGNKGDKGDPGVSNSTLGFVSAVSVGIDANASNLVAIGDTVKSFHVVNISNIAYNPTTGLFTSFAGPGYYEIHYGASWNGQCAVVLRVDGNEVNPFIDLNSPATWARESIIINTNEATPTFALANAKASAGPMVLAGKGSYSSAFITIKKIN